MTQTQLTHINSRNDAVQLAHHIVYDLNRPDYHPDDPFGVETIDNLVNEAFEVCGDDIYQIFHEQCVNYIKKAQAN